MKFKHSITYLALFATLSLSAFETYKEAVDSVNQKLKQNDFKAAMVDAEEAFKLADEKQKPAAMLIQANIFEREKKFKDAVEVLLNAKKLEVLAPAQKLDILRKLTTFYTRNLNDMKAALGAWTEIYDDKALHLGARSESAVNIARNTSDEAQAVAWIKKSLEVASADGKTLAGNDLAAAYNRAGAFYLAKKDFKTAAEYYTKTLAIEKIHEMQIRPAIIGMVDSSIGTNDLEGALKYLADFEGTNNRRDAGLLGRCAAFAVAQGKMDIAMDLRFRQFILGPFYKATIPSAFTLYFGECAKARAWKQGEKLAKDIQAFLKNPPAESKIKYPELTPELEFELELLAAAFASDGDLKNFKAPKVDMQKLDAAKLPAVYYSVSKIFAAARINDLAQHLAATAPTEVPVYSVKMIPQAPADISGWRNSDIYKDETKREKRFVKYNEKAAALLINDVNVVRDTATKYKTNEACTTSFFVTADPRGISIYVENKDDKLPLVRNGLEYGGMFEMYLQPGFSEAYFQWMLYPATGKLDVIDWMPNNKTFRSMKKYIKSVSGEYPEGVASAIFIPWTLVYDKLPKNGDEWALGVIPFVRAGGFTWGSGQVHEVHRFGRIKFENIEQFMPAIKREIVIAAWGKFRSDIGTPKILWADEVKGDAAFNKIMTEALAPYEEMGKKVSADMSDADVNMLFENAVPVWNEAIFFIDELRSRYLAEKLMAE